jgi:hypothetical protein
MLDYPITKTKICKFCKAPVTLTRQGDGHPGGGTLNYWYTTDHRCEKGEEAIASQRHEQNTLEQILFGDAS